MEPRLFTFAGGTSGQWEILWLRAVRGEPLRSAPRLAVVSGRPDQPVRQVHWQLSGVTSHERYVTVHERQSLRARQPSLGRPQATQAALIPIRKNAAWWGMAQDERRHLFEETSRHVAKGLRYLPAIARRLHHCRDLDPREPFDFLTWFEYAPGDAAAFEDLVSELRATEEWRFVERECDLRLTRSSPDGGNRG